MTFIMRPLVGSTSSIAKMRRATQLLFLVRFKLCQDKSYFRQTEMRGFLSSMYSEFFVMEVKPVWKCKEFLAKRRRVLQ